MVKQHGWVEQLAEAVTVAHKSGVEEMANIKTSIDYYNFLDYFVHWVPQENHRGKLIYDMICTQYFVLDTKPFSGHQSPIKPEPTPNILRLPLSNWIVKYAKTMGNFLDTPASAANLSTFYTAENFHVDAYILPEGGWKTFNEFFARKFLPGTRPVDRPSDQKVIVTAADSTFAASFAINDKSEVIIKGLPWTISELLSGSQYSHDFAGGKFMHMFLNTFDYHRQHAPVDGKVLEAKIIQGAAYLEVVAEKDPGGHNRIVPKRSVDAPDKPGYQFQQARGLIVIESPVVGKVAVLPIGMANVSSVVLSCKPGDAVTKGVTELSYFQFGGSDYILLFQAKPKVDIVATAATHYSVGQQIALVTE